LKVTSICWHSRPKQLDQDKAGYKPGIALPLCCCLKTSNRDLSKRKKKKKRKKNVVAEAEISFLDFL